MGTSSRNRRGRPPRPSTSATSSTWVRGSWPRRFIANICRDGGRLIRTQLFGPAGDAANSPSAVDNDSGPGDEIGSPGWALFSAEPHVELRRASLCGLVPYPARPAAHSKKPGATSTRTTRVSDYQSLGHPRWRSVSVCRSCYDGGAGAEESGQPGQRLGRH